MINRFSYIRATRTPIVLLLCASALCSFARPANASEVEAASFKFTDWRIPGDGKTPTFMQYLDVKGATAKPAKELVAATAKGDVTYSFGFDLPPAILKPSLGLANSSEGGSDVEMPAGWNLQGIAEIRRPIARAYETAGPFYENEWLLSGPGGSGTLKPSGEDDWRFFLRTTSPSLVIATFDESKNAWQVHSGGLIWSLTAKGPGDGTPEGTSWWRATRLEDPSGNYVTFTYYTGGRVAKVSYGGNLKTGAPHLVDVKFTYGNNAAVRTDARSGSLVKFDKHIELVTVSSSADKSTLYPTQWYAYDLVYTVKDAVDLLTSIKRQGKTSAEVETAANFTYSSYVNSTAPARTSTTMAPSSLGATVSRGHHNIPSASVSLTTKTVSDFNRDGLPDVVISPTVRSDKEWQIANQKVNHGTRSFSWNAPSSVNAVGGSLHSVTTTASISGVSVSSSITTRQLVDFDGDGYVDVVESDSVDEWYVFYGNADHHFNTTPEVETPPAGMKNAQKTWPLKADHINALSEHVDVIYGLMDLNGDEWLDAFDPASGRVWYHTGIRGGGFGAPKTLSYKFSGIRSVRYAVENDNFTVDSYSVCEEGCANDCEEEADTYVDVCTSDCQSGCDGRETCQDFCEDQCSEYDTGDLQSFYEACITSCTENDCDCSEVECNEERNCDFDCATYCEDGQLSDAELGIEDDIDGRDNVYSDCYGDCEPECNNAEDNHTKYIAETDETKAFYDLNGDGLPDHVDASATPWKIYVNTGRDFLAPVGWASPAPYLRRVDEGRPDISWDSSEMGVHEYQSGSPTRVYQALLDVDGDGLLDLAMGRQLGKKWHKNTGSGFETASRPLPAWWPDDFITSESASQVDGDEGTSTSSGHTTGMMLDLDHDGALDAVSLKDVKYGRYPRPNMLIKVTNAQGGETAIAYRSLATVSPSGDWAKPQNTPNVKSLADIFTTTDTRTGQKAQTNYTYSDGYYADGVFHGFKTRFVDQKINSQWTHQNQYDYELDRDLSPVAVKRLLFTDGNLSFGSTLSRGTTLKRLRFQIAETFEDKGFFVKNFRLLKSRKVTEYGESSGLKNAVMTYKWDEFGNLLSYGHDGGGAPQDAVTVAFNYVANAEPDRWGTDATYFRMRSKNVTGTDPLGGTARMVAAETYFYDGLTSGPLTKGILTRTKTAAGWTGGGESLYQSALTLDYGRGARGELTSVTDLATGIHVNQTYGFGGTVLTSQSNRFGHRLTRALDAQGRAVSQTDNNKLVIAQEYDAFNRVTKKTVTGTDGKASPYASYVYSRSSAPYYTIARLYDDAGSVDQTSYTLEDGFGNPAQTWTQGDNGNFLVSTALHDLRGLAAATSHPRETGTTFGATAVPLSVTDTFTKSYFDALGNARETVSDSAANTGAKLVYYDVPRTELRQDENGYQTKLTYDAQSRVIRVEQGKAGALTVTANYRYDPLDRLVRFEDARGTVYAYSYDGAGRLREVKHGGANLAATAFTSWYKYEYKGFLKTRMQDNAGAYATWDYDVIGRPVKLTVSDSLPSSMGPLVYTYAYDSAWVGALAKTTDPSGATEYLYDTLGRERQVKRAYKAGASGTQTPVFGYVHDLQGNLVSKTLPSRHNLVAAYDYGYLLAQSAVTSGRTDYKLSFDYNKWGLLSSVTSSLGHQYSQVHTTPVRLEAIKMQYGETSYQRAYKWENNGLLSARTEGAGTINSTYNFAYDSLKEITLVKNSLRTVESYAYDAAGNPVKMQDRSGAVWTYASAGPLNQIPGRTSSKGGAETYAYDPAGRLKTAKSASGTREYYYDGLGRLRGATKNGIWQTVLDYDADGHLVRRGDNNPFTGTPYYAYQFRDWRYDEKSKVTTETENGFVTTENGTRTWLFKDYDGHTAITFSDAGAVKSKRTLGAYGDVIASSGSPWQWNSFHGVEEQDDLFFIGQRHLQQKDGQWLQPEPLLYTGIPAGMTGDPLGLATYRYARNSPTAYGDSTGNYVESLWDAASLGMGIYSISQWDENTALWEKGLDVIGVVADGAALIAPIVPGGASVAFAGIKMAAKAYNAADTVADGSKLVDLGQTANKLEKGIDGGQAAGNALDAGKVADSSVDEVFVATDKGIANTSEFGSPDLIVTGDGVIEVPTGASGPFPADRGPGVIFEGGKGGPGMDPKVTGVRVMEASGPHADRYMYMNKMGQTVDPSTGRTVAPSDPAAHMPYKMPTD